ncbi:MAG: hypothetical protein WC763_04275 [Candidatus Paceibacterota bacterium]|jgi:hypothetical protein
MAKNKYGPTKQTGLIQYCNGSLAQFKATTVRNARKVLSDSFGIRCLGAKILRKMKVAWIMLGDTFIFGSPHKKRQEDSRKRHTESPRRAFHRQIRFKNLAFC